MSMEKKLSAAFKQGEQSERGRILWLMDVMRTELRDQLEDKILVEATRHIVQTKIKMVTALFLKLQHMIISNKQPPPKTEEPDHSKGLEMIDDMVEEIDRKEERTSGWADE